MLPWTDLVPTLTRVTLTGTKLQDLEFGWIASFGMFNSGIYSKWDSGCSSYCLLWHAWLVGLVNSSPSPVDFYYVFIPYE